MIKNLGTYDIPEWSLCYIVNGDADNLSDEEKGLVDDFLAKEFPHGYIAEVLEDDFNELDFYPAFGPTRDLSEFMLRHGESPRLACKTYKVTFYI